MTLQAKKLIAAGEFQFGEGWEDVSQQAKAVVRKMLVVDQEARASMRQVLNLLNWWGRGALAGSGSDALMRELHDAQDANAQLSAALDDARAEQTARLERSAQFVNLRQVRMRVYLGVCARVRVWSCACDGHLFVLPRAIATCDCHV